MFINIGYYFTLNFKCMITQIKDYLLDQTDGPVTKFVVIYRCIELSKISNHSNDDLSNVLYEVLENFVELPSNEFNVSN